MISLCLQHEDQLLVIKVLISYFFPQIWIHHFNWKFQWFVFFLLAGRGGQRSLQSLSGWCRGEESRAGQRQEWDYHSDPRDGLPVWPHPQGRKLKHVKSLKTCSFKLKPGWVVEIMHTSTDKLILLLNHHSLECVPVSGDRQLVPASAGPGCVSTCQPPDSVWKCQAVRAWPALHRLCQEFTYGCASTRVSLVGFTCHTKHRVRCPFLLFAVWMWSELVILNRCLNLVQLFEHLN